MILLIENMPSHKHNLVNRRGLKMYERDVFQKKERKKLNSSEDKANRMEYHSLEIRGLRST